MEDYKTRAKRFLKEVGARVSISYINTAEVPDFGDGHRNIYRVRVDRNGKSWQYRFHDSINHTNRGIRPDAYDVLSCVEQHPPGDIDEFMREFGYEIHNWADVKRLERIWKAVRREARSFQRIFGDVAEEFADVFG